MARAWSPNDGLESAPARAQPSNPKPSSPLMLMIVTFTLNAGFNLIVGLLTAKFLGPADFGRYALAQSIGVFLNTLFIDWLRHTATRFYSEHGVASAKIRATLDLMLGLSCLLIAALSAIAILLGFTFGLPLWLAAVAPAIGIVNGVFDVETALLRARFRDRPYAAAILFKNLFALILVVGSAALFHDPAVTLLGLCLSMLAAMLSVRASLIDREAKLSLASRTQAGIFARYALPIVAGGVLWQLMPLFNRSLIADRVGFDISGQYSLAYDLGVRIVAAIGSAVDILLLQLAIRADHEQGREAARAQLATNIVVVTAVLAPVCSGLWLVLPSFEVLFVPAAFQGNFARIFEALLPGLFAFSVLSYCVFQTFFIAEKTWPVTLASLIATLVSIGAVVLSGTADPVRLAQFQSVGFIASLLLGIVLSRFVFPVVPRFKDMAAIAVATGLVVLAVYPLRSLTPGLATMVLQALAGIGVFGAAMVAADVAGVRRWLMARLGSKGHD